MSADGLQDRDRRLRTIEEAAHSSEMAGLTVSPETLADGAEWAEGRIDIDEFGRRVRARYGLR